jgi:hypothetical protein
MFYLKENKLIPLTYFNNCAKNGGCIIGTFMPRSVPQGMGINMDWLVLGSFLFKKKIMNN